MSDLNRVTRRAVMLYLSGANLADIRSLPEVQQLIAQGALVELVPAPITGPQANYYQIFSGRLPASFGFFDSLMPLCHLPRSVHGAKGYEIVEELSGRDSTPKLLPDMLRTAGWQVEYKETSLPELVVSIQGVTQSESPASACKIIKCNVLPGQFNSAAATEALSEALRISREWLEEASTRVANEASASTASQSGSMQGGDRFLALFSDISPVQVKRFVNVNNFLAEMGIIERDEQSGLINWNNSLAYFAGHGQLWVNLLGRDPLGAVHPQDEYAEVCDTLVKALPIKLLDAGEPVIERVYRKEELYSDHYLFCAPDLVIVFKPGYAPSPNSSRLGFDEATFTSPAEHSYAVAGVQPSEMKGFLLASAPSLATGSSVSEPAQLTSVVPTLLHALNIEYVGMDSSAVSGLFTPSYLEAHPIRTGAAGQELSEEDEELVINRLRDLGYV